MEPLKKNPSPKKINIKKVCKQKKKEARVENTWFPPFLPISFFFLNPFLRFSFLQIHHQKIINRYHEIDMFVELFFCRGYKLCKMRLARASLLYFSPVRYE